MAILIGVWLFGLVGREVLACSMRPLGETGSNIKSVVDEMMKQDKEFKYSTIEKVEFNRDRNVEITLKDEKGHCHLMEYSVAHSPSCEMVVKFLKKGSCH